MSEYKVKLEVFEGPMALLMHLIEKDKVDIYDIPVAAVTEQYIEYLKAWEEFNMDIASEFLVMAATLLQIKSRMLLPKPPKAVDSEEEDGDPRQELVSRLLEYRKFKDMAAALEEMLTQRERLFTRSPREFAVQYVLPRGLRLEHLLTAFAAVWESTVENVTVIAREEISVQDKMQDILHLLYRNQGKVDFQTTMIRTGTRTELIAAFLAVLELIKLRRITIHQERSLGPIVLVLRDGKEWAGE